MIPDLGGKAPQESHTARRVSQSGTGPTQWNESVGHRVLGQLLSEFFNRASGTPEPLQRILGKNNCWTCTTMIEIWTDN